MPRLRREACYAGKGRSLSSQEVSGRVKRTALPMTRHIVLLVAGIGIGCSNGAAQMDESQRARIRALVDQRMQSFEAAERALNAEQLIGHFAPDFYIHNDGQRLSYDEMTTAVRAVFPTLRSIEGGFSDVNVAVLAPDAALTTATFQETVTDRAGARVRQRGAATWLWRYREGEWRIAYGHVDHYADPSTN
jgi:uncharacterized protein (TIGR02246 family)